MSHASLLKRSWRPTHAWAVAFVLCFSPYRVTASGPEIILAIEDHEVRPSDSQVLLRVDGSPPQQIGSQKPGTWVKWRLDYDFVNWTIDVTMSDDPMGSFAFPPNVIDDPWAFTLSTAIPSPGAGEVGSIIGRNRYFDDDVFASIVPLCDAGEGDCNNNGISDLCDVDTDLGGTSLDCNGNGIPDECDIAGAGTTTVFAEGMNVPEDIVAAQGDYPPGFFVPDPVDDVIYHVSPVGGTVTAFAPAISQPFSAAFAPDEFGRVGYRLFASFFTDGPSVHLIHPDDTVEAFADLASGARASGIVYIPEEIGGIAAGKLFVTSRVDTDGNGSGSIHLVDADGAVTTLISSLGSNIFAPALAPEDFGQFANHVFLSGFTGSELYAFDLTMNKLTLFAAVSLPTGDSPGLRQIAFSPVGWAAQFNPALANERVLLVSVASEGSLPLAGGGLVSVWDQRGRMLAALTRGPDGFAFQPRGLLFVKSDLLISDITDSHGWLIRATVDDFGLPDCDDDGILDECEIAAGSSDCNANGVPDECEIDCNDNGVADQCDLIDEFATDCNGNFIPDSCEEPDCNDNGFPDSCDLADGTSRDLNGNQVPDECDTFVGDFDDDKDTDLDDYAILESCLAFSGPGVAPVFEACFAVFDFDTDGDVDLRDVSVFEHEFTGGAE